MTKRPGSAAPASPPTPPRRLLADRRFRRAWAAGALAQTVRWLEVLVVSVFVYRLTGSAFQVALVLFLRLLPSFLFGAFAGAVAERLDRRTMLLTGFAGLTLLWAALAGLALIDAIRVWHVTLGVFLNGIFWAMDFPVRRTMLGDIAGAERVGMAMGFDTSTNNATRAIGPVLGGLLLETAGIAGAYALGAAFFVCAFVCILSVDYRPATAHAGSVLTNISEGIRHARSSGVIVGALAVTLVMNLWALAYMGMIPVIGEEVLDASAVASGALMAAEAVGALCGALVIAMHVRPGWYTRLYVGGSLLLLVCILLFSLSRSYVLSLGLLFLGGIGFAGFGTMQSTIILSYAAPQYRSRVMGVLAMAVGAGGPIGMLHVGLLARWLGAPAAVTVLAVEGLAALLAIAWFRPELWRSRGAPGG